MAECIVLSSDSEEEKVVPLLERVSSKSVNNRKRKERRDTGSDDELPSLARLMYGENYSSHNTPPFKAAPQPTSSDSNNVHSINKKTHLACGSEEDGGQSGETVSKSQARELKRQKALEEKEAKKRERDRKKAEKDQEKKLKKLVSQVETESRKETQPASRVKQMIVQIDIALTEKPELMSTLVSQLQEMETQYRIMTPSNNRTVVTWKRKKVDRSLNEEMTDVIENIQEIDEQYMLVVMSGKEFLNYVHASKLLEGSSSSEAITLHEHVKIISEENPSKQIIIAVENIEGALRAGKTQRNRNFRTAVRSNQTEASQLQIDVTYFDCEHYMTELYLSTKCCVRMCSTPSQVADLIVNYTKVIADVPFKKNSTFSFYGDLGPGATRKALQESKNELGLIWLHQLQQYPGVSNHVAAAIVSHYPTPSHLLKAYSECSSANEGELLLKNIEVRRGAGIIASTRRVGESISQRIYTVMTCNDSSRYLS